MYYRQQKKLRKHAWNPQMLEGMTLKRKKRQKWIEQVKMQKSSKVMLNEVRGS